MSALPGFTLITASRIYNADGSLLANGTATFRAVLASGQPVGYRVGGGSSGQGSRAVRSFPVLNGVLQPNGAMSGGSALSPQLPDTSLTYPTPIFFLVEIIDLSTGQNVLGAGYLIAPTGATFNLDAFDPAVQPGVTLAAGPQGPPGTSGEKYSTDESFTGSQTQTIVHGLSTTSPAISIISLTGRRDFFPPSVIDANTIAVRSKGTSTATIIVTGGAFGPPAPPTISTNPTTQTVLAGVPMTLISVGTGSPTPTYQWQNDGGSGGATWSDIGGATSPTYTFTPTNGQNGYQYRVIYTNSGGTATSSAAALTVVDLTTGLTNYWPMNEGTGTTLIDAVAANNMSTSGMTWVSGKATFAAPSQNSSGAQTGAVVPAVNNSANPFSISCWASFADLIEAWPYMMVSTTPFTFPGFSLLPQSTEFGVAVTNGSTGGANTVAGLLVAGTRANFILTYDGSGTYAGVNLYYNGSLWAFPSSPALSTIPFVYSSARPLNAMSSVGFTNSAPGTMDHLRIYDLVLSPTQIAAIVAGGF